MPDVAGYRSKFAVIVPSTNTVVEHDYNSVGPAGITFHTGRMYIDDPALDSDAAFEALLAQIRRSIEIAIRDVVTCEPDFMVMGMSAETFWDGIAGNAEFEARVSELSGGLGVATGATACKMALNKLSAKRIAVLSPYQEIADRMVTRFFEEAGYEVVRFRGLRCPSATAIADVTEDQLIRVLSDELAGPDIDAIVQVGTNLSMLGLSDEAERWLGIPVISINGATLWHALRSSGYTDQFRGFGTLLREL